MLPSELLSYKQQGETVIPAAKNRSQTYQFSNGCDSMF